MSKMWGSLIASPSSTRSKFPSCRAQGLLSIVEISRAEGRCFWFRGFFFWSYASVKRANLHRGVTIRTPACCGEQVDNLAALGVCKRAWLLLDFHFARPFTEVKKDCLWLEKEFCSRMKQRKAANSSLTKWKCLCMSQWKKASVRRTSTMPHDKCEITCEKMSSSVVCVFASERKRERERERERERREEKRERVSEWVRERESSCVGSQRSRYSRCWWHPTRKSALPPSTSCIFLRPVVETYAHQVVLVCSVRSTAALMLEMSPRMNVRAVDKGKQGHSFTISRSRSKAVTISTATVSCASQITMFATNHEVKQTIVENNKPPLCRQSESHEVGLRKHPTGA